MGDLMRQSDVWEFVGIIAGSVTAIVAALTVLWTKVLRPAIRWAQRMDDRLEYIDGEMRTNGGKSFRDKVTTRFDTLDERFDQIARHSDMVDQRWGDADIEGMKTRLLNIETMVSAQPVTTVTAREAEVRVEKREPQ